MLTALNIIPFDEWIEGHRYPLVIAGPCSAETEEQLMDTAQAIAGLPYLRIFRAGIWKPRSRPGDFEGVGAKGLPWLQKVKASTGLLTAVEVATPLHVEECMKNGIDVLWIGARTVVNPFSVQEISEALRGTNIPVMVKNPVNPDIKLWMGALERLNQIGIKKLAAIHRGFSVYDPANYRNSPHWEIPIELKRLLPGLPIISDPSHISGKASLVGKVAQKALDLLFDGIMVETHIHPEEALTDQLQQLDPEQLGQLLENLEIKSEGINVLPRLLGELRADIDQIDNQLVDLLAMRFKVVEEIGRIKSNEKISTLQLNRWQKVLENVLEKGNLQGLNQELLKKIWELIHSESIRIQGMESGHKP